MRRWCDGGGRVLTRMLYGDEKSFSASLDTAIRLPVARGPGASYRQVRLREVVGVVTIRKMGATEMDVLLDEVLEGKVDAMLDGREANMGALLRLRRHFPDAAMKLNDEQWMYLSEMYEGGMTVSEVAKLHGVNKSTVSRSVNRGKRILQDYLQFCL